MPNFCQVHNLVRKCFLLLNERVATNSNRGTVAIGKSRRGGKEAEEAKELRARRFLRAGGSPKVWRLIWWPVLCFE